MSKLFPPPELPAAFAEAVEEPVAADAAEEAVTGDNISFRGLSRFFNYQVKGIILPPAVAADVAAFATLVADATVPDTKLEVEEAATEVTELAEEAADAPAPDAVAGAMLETPGAQLADVGRLVTPWPPQRAFANWSVPRFCERWLARGL